MLSKEETLALVELLEEVEQEATISLLNLARDKQLTNETEQVLKERIFFCQFFSQRFLTECHQDQEEGTLSSTSPLDVTKEA